MSRGPLGVVRDLGHFRTGNAPQRPAWGEEFTQIGPAGEDRFRVQPCQSLRELGDSEERQQENPRLFRKLGGMALTREPGRH